MVVVAFNLLHGSTQYKWHSCTSNPKDAEPWDRGQILAPPHPHTHTPLSKYSTIAAEVTFTAQRVVTPIVLLGPNLASEMFLEHQNKTNFYEASTQTSLAVHAYSAPPPPPPNLKCLILPPLLVLVIISYNVRNDFVECTRLLDRPWNENTDFCSFIKT